MRSVLKAFSPPALGLAAALAAPAAAEDFDYWLLALSWSPSWCRDEADPGAEQCDPSRDLGFVLHGLWPQYEDGWPEDCASPYPDPTRRQTAAMADIMGSGDLAWYQWKKHGRCAGMPADAWFAAARHAFAGVTPPRPGGMGVTAEALERGFLAGNPDLDPDSLFVTCRDRTVREVRICLDRDLAPRTCGADVLAAACRSRGPLDLPPAP
jgi:ribonuclease T2